MDYRTMAAELHSRRYPDVAATALRHLRVVERLRDRPGYEKAQHWGVGPQHEELWRLGLVEIGAADPCSGARPVELTDAGRAVAAILVRLSGKLEIDLGWGDLDHRRYEAYLISRANERAKEARRLERAWREAAERCRLRRVGCRR